MCDIFEFNKSVIGSLELRRDSVPERMPGLAPIFWNAVQSITDRLKELIPDDFDFYLCLDGQDVDFTLEFENGFNSGAGFPVDFNSSEELFSKLARTDWDKQRHEGMRMAALLDEQIARSRRGKKK